MIETLRTSQVVERIINDNYSNYSYNGALKIAEIEESIEEMNGQPMELDLATIRGTYSEYGSLEELNEDLHQNYESIEELERVTTVWLFDGGLIINCY